MTVSLDELEDSDIGRDLENWPRGWWVGYASLIGLGSFAIMVIGVIAILIFLFL